MFICIAPQRAFSAYLARSTTLQTLTDIGETHATHGTQAFFSRENVKVVMKEVPNLQKLVTIDRIWTVRITVSAVCVVTDAILVV